MEAVKRQQLYFPEQGKGVAFVTLLAIVSAIVILGSIVAIVCAAPSASLKELDLKSK